MLASVVLMVPAIIWGEKKDRLKEVFIGAIILMLLTQLGFSQMHFLSLLLVAYFVSFNVLEATLPSLISKFAPANAKGTAMGVYNTTQSLGIFFGGAVSGWLFEYFGTASVFFVCAVVVGVWLLFALSMQAPVPVRTKMLQIGEYWQGDPARLAESLSRLEGVIEAMVDERVAYLKVSRQGWDEVGAKALIQES
jgi:MFS family permease